MSRYTQKKILLNGAYKGQLLVNNPDFFDVGKLDHMPEVRKYLTDDLGDRPENYDPGQPWFLFSSVLACRTAFILLKFDSQG